MSAIAKKDKPKLWKNVKAQVTAGDKGGKPGQWSARKGQLATHEYQKRGGGYEGGKAADNHLRQWTAQTSATHEGGLHALTRPALLDLAAQHNIRGRSRMRKAQLLQALEHKGLQ